MQRRDLIISHIASQIAPVAEACSEQSRAVALLIGMCASITVKHHAKA